MYNRMKLSVDSDDQNRFFSSNVGLFLGEITSPLLFFFFVFDGFSSQCCIFFFDFYIKVRDDSISSYRHSVVIGSETNLPSGFSGSLKNFINRHNLWTIDHGTQKLLDIFTFDAGSSTSSVSLHNFLWAV